MKKNLGLLLCALLFFMGIAFCFVTIQILVNVVKGYLYPQDRLILVVLFVVDTVILLLFFVAFFMAYQESPLHSELSVHRISSSEKPFVHSENILKLDFGTYLGYGLKLPFFFFGVCFIYFFFQTYQIVDVLIGLVFTGVGLLSFFMRKFFYWDKKNNLFMFSGELFNTILIKRVFEAPEVYKVYLDIEKHAYKDDDGSEGDERFSYYEIQLNTSLGYIELWGQYTPNKVEKNLKLMQEYAMKS